MTWEQIQISQEPLSLSEVKNHLRLLESDTSEDAVLTMLISAVREFAENYTGVAIALQQIRVEENGKSVVLPRAPIVSIVSVQVDGEDMEYERSGRVISVDTAGDITVVYNAGMSSVPAMLKIAMLMILADWYENREAEVLGAVTAIMPSLGAMTMLNHYREWWF